MPGMTDVAMQVEGIVNTHRVQRMRQQRGMRCVTPTLHMCFVGNPGTGKTTVARLVAEALAEAKVLTKGHLVEVERADLVGRYIGHTAPNVRDALDRAIGGVLFIDEAHGLISDDRDPFGHEALDALVKGMEDRRAEVCVVLAGYPTEMQRLLNSNPGLRSRVGKTIDFPNYDAPTLKLIFHDICTQYGYQLEKAADDVVNAAFQRLMRLGETSKGNGRLARNMFDQAIQYSV